MVRIVRSALTLSEVGEQTTRSPCLLAAHSLAICLPRWQWKYLVVPGGYEKSSIKLDLVGFVTAHTLSNGQ